MNPRYLKKRGWTAEEIASTRRVLSRIHAKSHPGPRKSEEYMYWASLFIALAANIIIAIALIPSLLLLSSFKLYLLLLTLGISFGTLFAVLLKDLSRLRPYHFPVLLGIVIISHIIFIMAVSVSNSFALATHDPYLIAITYGVSFLIPNILYLDNSLPAILR